jgi:FHA domain
MQPGASNVSLLRLHATACSVPSSYELVLIDSTGRELVLTEQPVLVGSGADCDIRLDAPAASLHVRVSRSRVEAVAECLLGAVPLEAGKSRHLAGASLLHVGGVELRIEERWDVKSVSTRRLAFALAKLATVPEIVVVEGTDLLRTLPLTEGKDCVIGRASSCDLPLDDVTISREHLAVTWRAGTVLVRDLDSTRGTFLGTTRLDSGRRALWSADHMIRVGRTVLALRLPAQQEQLLAQVSEPPGPSTEPPSCDDAPHDEGRPAPASSRAEESTADAPMAPVPAAIPAATPRRRASLLGVVLTLGLLLVALGGAGLLIYIFAVA